MQMATSYAGHVLLTVWRRKSTLLGACAGILLLLVCLQYSSVGSNTRPQTVLSPSEEALKTLRNLHRTNKQSREEDDGNPQQKHTVRFVPTNKASVVSVDRQDKEPVIDEARAAALAAGDTPSRDEITEARGRSASQQIDAAVAAQQQQQQLKVNGWQEGFQGGSASRFSIGALQDGLPAVDLDPDSPYVPPARLVHLDLKGAPPKVDYLKRLFPLLAELGATGLLLEWEDMFPFKGPLSTTAARNHYSRREIYTILEIAKANNLEVIPLIQTFGHLEFVLKHSAFDNLREVPEVPLALCPSRNESFRMIQRMVEQVMSVHKHARYIHIGCDEVFYMGECDLCRHQPRETLFLQHVSRVAGWVRTKFNLTPIIWDDMLRQIPLQTLQESGIGSLVEPMVWVYAEDVYRFVSPGVWDKFARVFPHVWAASAFKGAFGETLVIPDVRRHLENNLRWLEVMWREGSKFSGGFRGIVITGWQRYDHFAVLCELLPAGVPSLAVNLIATSHGYFNQSLRRELYRALHCSQMQNDPPLNLFTDPHLTDRLSWCVFPGSTFFKMSSRLSAVEREVDEYVTSVTKSKGWLTDYNIRHNFSSPMRLNEALYDYPRVAHSVSLVLRGAKEALSEVFDMYTVAEWIEQKIYPMLHKLETLEKMAESMKKVTAWPGRPFPPLPELKRYGIRLDTDNRENKRR